MGSKRLEVVVRCKNEMPWVARTLEQLARADVDVLVIDSGSSDGSLAAIERAGVRLIRIAPENYVPGRVLNDAMSRTTGNIVAFVNADAIPCSGDAVELLASACREGAAAAYGRQLARSHAKPSTKRDYARAFPDDPRGPGFRHFFSMAASAIRRDAWETLPFDELLRYSEDVDWTFRLKALGLRVDYVPDARFEHSHDYDLLGAHRRMVGEGTAHRAIFREGRPSAWRGLVQPLVAQVARDAVAGIATRSLATRVACALGRYRGRTRGDDRPEPAAAVPPARTRFTLGGDAAHEALVKGVLEHALATVDELLGTDVVATLLLGGFGCGEGAIEVNEGTPRLHNDLDMVVVAPTQRDALRLRARCHEVSARATERAGVAVDVWPTSREELARRDGRLWVDAAVRGARVVRGDAGVLDDLRGADTRSVSADEVGRLVTNRATGVALSRLAMDARAPDHARTSRHVAKAWLAIGDAVLITVDRYSGRLEDRHHAIKGLGARAPGLPARIAAGYARAVSFRHDPTPRSWTFLELTSEARAQWSVIADLEARRMGVARFATAWDYFRSPIGIYAELADVRPLARVLGGARAASAGRLAWRVAGRHPRDTLARVSILLAYADDRSAAHRAAAATLCAPSAAPDLVARALARLVETAA